jgi:hypothetical protein
MKKYNIVYKITNLINNKLYIGIHSTDNLNDRYFGSGRALKNAIKKYGRKNFKKEILFNFKTRDEALKKEAELVTKEVVENRDFYNLISGGKGNVYISEETRQLWSKQRKGRNTPNMIKGNKELVERKKQNGDFVKIKAINIITGEERNYLTIKECAEDLGLHATSISRLVRKHPDYARGHLKDWTFETEKFGKIDLKIRELPKNIKVKKFKDGKNDFYRVIFNDKYIGGSTKLEEAIKIKEAYLKGEKYKPKRSFRNKLISFAQETKNLDLKNYEGKLPGAYYCKDMKKYVSCITRQIDGKKENFYIGSFESKYEAHMAFRKKHIELFGQESIFWKLENEK